MKDLEKPKQVQYNMIESKEISFEKNKQISKNPLDTPIDEMVYDVSMTYRQNPQEKIRVFHFLRFI